MKRAILSLSILITLGGAQCLLAGPTQVETKDSKAMPQAAVEPLCSWTGFYFGIHGGYAWGDHSFLEQNESDPPYGFDDNGFFGGGQVGFNLQLGSMFLVGLEGEFAGGDIDDSDVLATGEASTGTLETDWMGNVAGRVGLIFWNARMLVYAKGGVAFSHYNFHTDDHNGETLDADDTRVGPMVGFGLEYAFNCHWSVKAEYKHLFLGDEDVTGRENDNGDINDRTFHVDGDQDLVEFGLNYRF